MNIFNFQSGEFHGNEESFWKDFFSVGIPVFVTILIFIGDKILQRRKEEKQKSEKEKERLIYFSTLIKGAEGVVEKQITICEELSSAIKQNPIVIPEIRTTTLYDFTKTFALNQEEYYFAYLSKINPTDKKDSTKKFTHITSSIEFFYETIKQIIDVHDRSVRQYHHPRKIEFKDREEKVSTRAAKLLFDLRHSGDAKYHRLNVQLEKIYVQRKNVIEVGPEIADRQDTDLNKIVTEFLIPLRDLSLAYPSDSNQEIFEIGLETRNLIILFYSIQSHSLNFASNLDELSEQLKKVMPEFKIQVESLFSFAKEYI